jgi:hypothetical protein
MRKEMDDLARRLNVFQNDMRKVKDDVRDVKDDARDVKDDVRDVKDDVRDVKDEVKLTQEKMACITKEVTERSEWFTGKQKIFVCGGNDGKTNFNSVESYSWPENSWTLEPAMKETRSAPSAFAHGREIYVSGGSNGTNFTDSIETLNVGWLPVKYRREFHMTKLILKALYMADWPSYLPLEVYKPGRSLRSSSE